MSSSLFIIKMLEDLFRKSKVNNCIRYYRICFIIVSATALNFQFILQQYTNDRLLYISNVIFIRDLRCHLILRSNRVLCNFHRFIVEYITTKISFVKIPSSAILTFYLILFEYMIGKYITVCRDSSFNTILECSPNKNYMNTDINYSIPILCTRYNSKFFLKSAIPPTL